MNDNRPSRPRNVRYLIGFGLLGALAVVFGPACNRARPVATDANKTTSTTEDERPSKQLWPISSKEPTSPRSGTRSRK